MYIILVYDVNVDRVSKVMRVCREYLDHIRNSVFEGDITMSNFHELKMRIKKIIDIDVDSVLIFNMRSEKSFDKQIIGLDKHPTENII